MLTKQVYIVVNTELVGASEDAVTVYTNINAFLDHLFNNYVEPYNARNDYDVLKDYNLTPDDFYNHTKPDHWTKVKTMMYEMWSLTIHRKEIQFHVN